MDLLRRLGRDVVQDTKFFWRWLWRRGLRGKLELIGWMISHGIWTGAVRFLRYGLRGLAWHLEIRELERDFYNGYDLYKFTERFIGGIPHTASLASEGAECEYWAERAAQVQFAKDKVTAVKIKLDEARRNHP